MGRDHATEIAEALAAQGPFSVLTALGLKYRRNGRSASLCCPFHGDRNPSATFRIGQSGTLQLRCHSACARSWDVHAVIAQANGLDPQRDFRRVLLDGARIAGLYDVVDELERRESTPREDRIRKCNAPPAPDRPYLSTEEVDTLWSACTTVAEDSQATDYFADRGIDVAKLDAAGLVRVIPPTLSLPRWAAYRGTADRAAPWTETGHRAIVRVYDAMGIVRSVRALRLVVGGDMPKRLPPSGYRASGLVMANSPGVRLLQLGPAAVADLLPNQSLAVVIAEGEPDFITDATTWDGPVLGITSGSWTGEMASRIPDGSTVILRTDHDAAGDKYAREVNATIGHRCKVLRSADAGFGVDENDRLKAGSLPAVPDGDAEPMPIPQRTGLGAFLLGERFKEAGWVGGQIRRGTWAVRCPGEELHATGQRFDGSTVLRAPSRAGDPGEFECRHDECRGVFTGCDVVAMALERVARSEGL